VLFFPGGLQDESHMRDLEDKEMRASSAAQQEN